MIDAAVIEKEAMQLSEAQRALLAERLLDSISPVGKELKKVWLRESAERLQAYRAGAINASDGPQALAHLRRKLAEVKGRRSGHISAQTEGLGSLGMARTQG